LRFLANENIPLIVVEQLKDEGFDIISASRLYGGVGDKEILREGGEGKSDNFNF